MSNNIPKIRFKGFTHAWEQRTLGEVAEISSASRVHKEDWMKEGVPFFRSSDVVSAFKNAENVKAYISYDLYKELVAKSGKVRKGDVLVTGGGSIAIPYIVTSEDPLYFKDADLIWFKMNQFLNGSFVYYFYSSPKLRNYVSTISHVGTIPHYTIEQAKATPLSLPSVHEQAAISNFFRTLDDAITLHKRKLEGLKELKSAYLQQMFPQAGENLPRVRFAGFTGDWKKRKLGEMVKKLKSYSLSRDVETKEETGYRYIHYGDIHKQVADLIVTDKQLPCIKISDYIPLNRGDLVLADASEDYTGIAEPSIILHEPHEKIIAGLHTIALRPQNTNALYLYYLLHTDTFKKYGCKAGTGLKVFGITFDNLSIFETTIPIIEEQIAIGYFFYNFDCIIEKQKIKLDKLKQLKSAYLQKLFV